MNRAYGSQDGEKARPVGSKVDGLKSILKILTEPMALKMEKKQDP